MGKTHVSVARWFAVAAVLFTAACDEDQGPEGGGHPSGTCEDNHCGGDPVGVWDLVTFCAGPETVAVTERLSFAEDGVYSYTSSVSGNSYSGTWEIRDDGLLVITVNGESSVAEYCVGDDLFWWSTGELTVVRERASAEGDPPATTR